MLSSDSDLQPKEITLRQLFVTLWRGRWTIVSVTLAFVVASAIAALLVPKTYRATVVLAPVSDTGTNSQLASLGSIASQFGLGSLASLTGSSGSRSAESVAVLESGALTQRYISENGLLQNLYSTLWNSQTKSWNTSNSHRAPTLWKAVEKFKTIRNVRTDAKSGLVFLSITWTDASAAALWANDLVKMTNSSLRARAIDESERNIAYLNEEAGKTPVVEARQTVYKLLEGELNKVMLARGTDEYAFKVIDPAVVPEKAYSPRVAVWIVAALAGGMFTAALLVLMKDSLGIGRESD